MNAIGNTFHTEEKLLGNLLAKIGEGAIQLPDFQRGWVWDDFHIRSLIASVSRGFPMGALMSMETGGADARFSARPFAGVNPLQEPDLLMLDGQQRTTSMYLALMHKGPVRTYDAQKNEISRYYYLDMKACLVGDDRIDAVISVPESRIITTNFGRNIELDLSTREKEFENCMFPLNIIYDHPISQDWLMDYLEYYHDDDARKKIYKQFNTEVIVTFLQYKVPIIRLSKNTPKEAVCQVFENVNTGGVSLTVFELLTATFAADNYNLREDWEQRRKKLEDVDPVLEGIDETSYLVAVTLLSSYRKHIDRGTAVSCKRRDVLNLSLDEYRNCADDVLGGLMLAAKLLHSQKIFETSNLPYQTQLIPLSVICACLGNRYEEPAIKQKIARWYWCGVLGELYGSANETRYALDIQNFMTWVNGGDEPATIRDASFMPTRLLSLQTRNSAAYKGIIALMMLANCRDFINGDTIERINYFDDKIDIHHIFPAHYCKQNGLPIRKWNSVVNKAPLSSRTNRMLGGKAPSNYIERIIQNGTIDRDCLEENLRSQLIVPGLLEKDDFDDFLVERSKSLLDIIGNAMGKTISGRDSDETIGAFGASLS